MQKEKKDIASIIGDDGQVLWGEFAELNCGNLPEADTRARELLDRLTLCPGQRAITCDDVAEKIDSILTTYDAGVLSAVRRQGVDSLGGRNPYLYARTDPNITKLIKASTYDKYTASRESTFGDCVFEEIAQSLLTQVGGQRGATKGLDIQLKRGDDIHLIQVKSGESVFNGSSVAKQGHRFAKQKGHILNKRSPTAMGDVISVIVFCYGKTGITSRRFGIGRGSKFYDVKISGQSAWYYLSGGDSEFYKELAVLTAIGGQEREQEIKALMQTTRAGLHKALTGGNDC